MSRQAWLTKNSIPAGRVNYVLTLPADEAWHADFLGAFLLLTQEENWEQFETLTPAEMADEWLKIFLAFESELIPMLPPGLVSPYAGQGAPAGWLLCHGQTVLRADYPALFAVIATLYGASVGETEFNIPDLRHRVPAGVDEDGPAFFDIGDSGGELTHTLTTAEIPVHTHLQNPHGHLASVANTGTLGTNQWRPDNTGPGYFPTQNETAVNQNTGGGASHNNMPPYLALNYIIKT